MRRSSAVLGGAALVAAAVLVAAGVFLLPSETVETSTTLFPHLVVERSFTDPPGGRRLHVYLAELRAGDALHVVVDQLNLDIALNLVDPRGRRRRWVDGPNGPDGPETLAVIVDEAGTYRLEVAPAPAAMSSREGAAQGYRLAVESLGAPGERDEALAAGTELFARAEQRPWRREPAVRADAERDYRAALEAFRAADEGLLEARTWRRLGLVDLARGELDPAIRSFEKALERYEQQGNGWERAPLFNDAGKAYQLRGHPEQARELFEQAIAVSEPLDFHMALAAAFNNLGVLHASLDEMHEALVAYDRAVREWRRLGNRSRQATVLHNLGVLYLALGRLDDSRDFLRRALGLRRDVDDRGGQAVTLTALGWLDARLGDLEAALAAYDEALILRRAVGDGLGEAVTLDQRGTVYLRMGRHDAAIETYLQALRRVGGHRLSEAYTRVNLGEAYLETGRFDAALDSLGKASRIFHDMGVHSGRAVALSTRARVERRMGRFDAARRDLEAALEIIESVRGRLQSRWLRGSYLAVQHHEYTAYIDLLVELDDLEPGRGHAARAFEASERARSRALLESLAEARAGVRTAADPELLERERTLWTRIHALELRRKELLEAGLEHEAGTLDTEVRKLLLGYEKVQGTIRASGAHGLREPQPLDLEAVRREVLDEGTLLLAYTLGEPRSFLWAIDRETLTVHVLPPRSEIEALARRVHELLPRSGQRSVRRQTAITVADLGGVLLGPVAGRLGNRRLLIVADGALHYIPFGALPAPTTGDAITGDTITGDTITGDTITGDTARPLLADHEIVYLPSASVLALQRRELAKRPAAPGLLAVVADPVFEADDPRLTAPTDRDFGGGFERLPFAGTEAEILLSIADGDEVFRAVGFDANRDMVLGGELDRYRIVHFATHGVLDSRHPALSGLVLSRVDEHGRPRDGMLRVHELFDLHLSADLVVLSACRTALGQEIRGEGLIGLTHGFFYAGAARLVVSFWNVDDRATAELMERFYRGLLHDGLPPSQALRAAQLSMLAEPQWESPYYWAGFALQGEWR